VNSSNKLTISELIRYAASRPRYVNWGVPAGNIGYAIRNWLFLPIFYLTDEILDSPDLNFREQLENRSDEMIKRLGEVDEWIARGADVYHQIPAFDGKVSIQRVFEFIASPYRTRAVSLNAKRLSEVNEHEIICDPELLRYFLIQALEYANLVDYGDWGSQISLRFKLRDFYIQHERYEDDVIMMIELSKIINRMMSGSLTVYSSRDGEGMVLTIPWISDMGQAEVDCNDDLYGKLLMYCGKELRLEASMFLYMHTLLSH